MTTNRRTKSYWVDHINALTTAGAHILPSTPSSGKALETVLDNQGTHPNSPLRGPANDHRSDYTLIYRASTGRIVATLAYCHSKKFHDLEVINMRVANNSQGQGIGTAKLTALAQQHPDCTMQVHGAVESAKPFYARTGASFDNPFSSIGKWGKAAMAALRNGRPQRGHIAES